MICRFTVVILIFSFFTVSAQASDKYMYSFGGAGDDGANTFIEEFKLNSVQAKGYGWKDQILFNGNHPEDLAAVKHAAQDPTAAFSVQNFANSLQQIIKDATPTKAGDPSSAKIKAGDQVLIMVDTHGSPSSNGKGHLVACSDGLCDLGQLAPVLKTLEANGVKVALVDLSCYSGNSLNLDVDSKICVISGASKDDVGWSNFGTNMISAMHPGQSLETSFLNARKQISSLGLPQISTDAGTATTALLQKMGKESVVHVSAENVAIASSKNSCKSPDMTQLIRTVQQLGDLETQLDAIAYVESVANYQKIYRQAEALALEIKKSGGFQHVKDNDGIDFTWSNLASRDDIDLRDTFYGAYAIKQQLKKDPAFQKVMKLQSDFDHLTNANEVRLVGNSYQAKTPLADAAVKVQHAEKALYDKLYRSQSRKNMENPCAKFIL